MKLSSRIIRKIGLLFKLSFVGRYQYKFYEDGGDLALRYNYELSKDSIVFDLGSYKGEFIDNIMFDSIKIHAFEIDATAYEFLINKYKNNPAVVVNDFGLGDREIYGCSGGKGAGNFLKENITGKLLVKKFETYCEYSEIKEIELIKINIEGFEYDLIEYLDNIGYLNKIKYLQIQPHDFVENSLDKLLNMHRILSKTHRLQKSYPFVWDFWEKINAEI
jgi:FkbM family methyltransferase